VIAEPTSYWLRPKNCHWPKRWLPVVGSTTIADAIGEANARNDCGQNTVTAAGLAPGP